MLSIAQGLAVAGCIFDEFFCICRSKDAEVMTTIRYANAEGGDG